MASWNRALAARRAWNTAFPIDDIFRRGINESLASNHVATDANTAADVFLRADAATLDTQFSDGFESQ